MLAPVLVTSPDSTPVTLAEARRHCRIESDDTFFDDDLTGFIAAAAAHLDGWSGILGRALVTQTWRQDFAGFGGVLRLPLLPVASIASITYYDTDNAQQTLATSIYELRVDAQGAYVALEPDQVWPSTYDRVDAVSVTFVAGTAVADVPAPIKQAMLLMVGHWFANHEAVVVGAPVAALQMAVDALLKPYRRVGL